MFEVRKISSPCQCIFGKKSRTGSLFIRITMSSTRLYHLLIQYNHIFIIELCQIFFLPKKKTKQKTTYHLGISKHLFGMFSMLGRTSSRVVTVLRYSSVCFFYFIKGQNSQSLLVYSLYII